MIVTSLWLAGCVGQNATPHVFWVGQADASTSAPASWSNWNQQNRLHPWAAPWLNGWKSQSRTEQIQSVQQAANRMPFAEDKALWGVSDYWAQPGEFFARGGDCEDYALAKLAMLRQLGWPEENMRLLLVQDMARGGMEHALLWVRLENRLYLLDSQTAGILDAETQKRYLPRYGMNAAGFWRY